jgi:mannose-6-phosphate isomerase
MPYPLKFYPLYQERIWGSKDFATILNRQEQAQTKSKIGESWEISDNNNQNQKQQSIISNGFLQGKTINQLRQKYQHTFTGKKINPKNPLNLLVKILYSLDDLSIQVHPNKQDLIHLPKDAKSKNEMWYVLDSKKDSKIFAGLKSNINFNQFINQLNDVNLPTDFFLNHINTFISKKDFAYDIQAGTIHFLGKNNLILEIQENSDTTYRIHDFNRVDKTTNQKRDLHLKESKICLKNHTVHPKDLSQLQQNNCKNFINNNYFSSILYKRNHNFHFKKNFYKYHILSILEGTPTITSQFLQEKANKYNNYLIPSNVDYNLISNKSYKFLITYPNETNKQLIF